jgi:hypothetical protein
MIWNIYRLEDLTPCGRCWFCSYAKAEARAIGKYGAEVMVIDIISDRRRLRAERDLSDRSDRVEMPSKGGPYLP